jgi:hypothetical protein
MSKVVFVGVILMLGCPSVAAAADADPEEALFNLACARLAGAIAGNSEEVHRAEMSGWIRMCSAHPRQNECIETARLIKGQNKVSPLHCGSDIKKNSDIAGSFLPVFDRICANVTAAWLSHTENQHQVEVAGWVKTCNAHPAASVCKNADDLIDENRKVRPLNCGSNGG